MKKQLGFTLSEIFIVLWGIACLALVGGVIYAAIHFIAKFW